MTEDEIIQEFSDIFQNAFPASQIDHYEKLSGSSNKLAIQLRNGSWLFFTGGGVWELVGDEDCIFGLFV